jgi:hypothetical protein
MTRDDVRAAIVDYMGGNSDVIEAINIKQDPQVDDVWAVRVEFKSKAAARAVADVGTQHADYVVYGSSHSLSGFRPERDIEEVQFKCWPPKSHGGFV